MFAHWPVAVKLKFFFFSSRRRHTSFDCDWSSDVCSSDLDVLGAAAHAGVEKHETVRQFSKPRWGDRNPFDLEVRFAAKSNHIEPAERGKNLILQADGLPQNISLDVYCGPGKCVLTDVSALKCSQPLDETNREAGRRTQTTERWKI